MVLMIVLLIMIMPTPSLGDELALLATVFIVNAALVPWLAPLTLPLFAGYWWTAARLPRVVDHAAVTCRC